MGRTPPGASCFTARLIRGLADSGGSGVVRLTAPCDRNPGASGQSFELCQARDFGEPRHGGHTPETEPWRHVAAHQRVPNSLEVVWIQGHDVIERASNRV